MEEKIIDYTMPPKDTANDDYLINQLNNISTKTLDYGPTTVKYDNENLIEVYEKSNLTIISNYTTTRSPISVSSVRWQLNETTATIYQASGSTNDGLPTSTIVLISIVIVLIILMLLTLIYYILRPNDRSGSPEDGTTVEGTYVRETNKVVLSKQQQPQQAEQGSTNVITAQQSNQVATIAKQTPL